LDCQLLLRVARVRGSLKEALNHIGEREIVQCDDEKGECEAEGRGGEVQQGAEEAYFAQLAMREALGEEMGLRGR
jgi:hypothetical protein